MNSRPRNAARTREIILEAARELFGERDLSSVSIRDIAEAAGVSHGLVQQYLGSREQMIGEIVRREVESFALNFAPIPTSTSPSELERLEFALKSGRERFQDFATLITRAELAGLEPEKMLNPDVPTPAMLVARAILEIREGNEGTESGMDAALVAAYVTAALFGFATMSPWLMTVVGLAPEDYDKRWDELMEITVTLARVAAGLGPGNHAQDVGTH